jgi:hypothetical protein
LVSGQNSQVYFAHKHYKPDVDVLFYTQASQKNLIPLREALKESKIVEETAIHAFEYAKIKRVIADSIEKHQPKKNEIILNFTGGTKIQSVVMFESGRDHGLKTVYVNSEQHNILELGGQFPVKHSTLDLRIDPVEYLLVNGQKVKDEIEPVSPNSEKLVKVLSQNFKEFSKFVLDFAKLEPLKRGFPVEKEVTSGRVRGSKYRFKKEHFYLKLVLDDKILFEVEEKPARLLVEDVTGKWLEKAVFKRISDSGLFGEVNMNVKIAYTSKEYKNEFDILAMKGTDLCLFECKSGNVKASDIDQLVAIRKMLGAYTRLFIVSWFSPSILMSERLEENNITALSFPNLTNELKEISLYNPNI